MCEIVLYVVMELFCVSDNLKRCSCIKIWTQKRNSWYIEILTVNITNHS